MKNIFVLTCLSFSILACKSQPKEANEVTLTSEQMINSIREVDDSLRNSYKRYMKDPKPEKQIDQGMVIRLANKQVLFYQKYPEHEMAPEYLDKAFQLYYSENKIEEAVNYGKVLIENYPDYKGRLIAILNLAAIFDGVLDDRESAVKYYKLLLDEYPNLEKETKIMITERLKNADLSQQEFIIKQNK